jgi:uncharacterized RDD family membrane protein YckC
MAGTERLYLLKTVDGEEYGPVDQECLVRWAENGRITAYCQIRSTLIARWEKACEIPFLREILLTQIEQKDPGDTSFLSRVRTKVTRRAAEASAASGLHEVRPEDFESAPVPLRVAAGLFDLLLAGLLAVGAYLLFALLFSMNVLDGNSAFYLGVLAYYGTVLLGLAWILAVIGQTPGQKFWGIILIKRNGEQFYLGRACIYGVLTLTLGLLTPFIMFVAPSRRSLQEIVTGTRMVKVKLIGKRR